jgi:hypothetical protein
VTERDRLAALQAEIYRLAALLDSTRRHCHNMAQTRLQQPGLRTNYVNYGPVPLLYAYSAWRLTDAWRVESDLDGFPAPGGGGLIDTSARAVWAASPHASVFLGLRYQAGGATQDTFFNCLHQRSALAGVRFYF